MEFRLVAALLLVWLAIGACGDDPPPPATSQVQRQPTAQPAAAQRDAAPASADRQTHPAQESDEEQGELAAASDEPPLDHAVASGSEGAAVTQQPAGPTELSSEDASCVEQVAPQAQVRGVIAVDTDVRIRPGERSPATGQVKAGRVVTVLRRSSGWTLIRYCRDRRGWIASQWLDHDGVQASRTEHETQERPPQLVAEYRGERYGVMGQSADGSTVRLLPPDDTSAEIVQAPIDEVALVDADLGPEDLPILIADETVVFPGGNFRARQGRVLPPADEWMWLPWGWLLGHNDEHVWEWRPQTDELQLAPRPPGPASLSLDGQHLAVAAPEGRGRAPREELLEVARVPSHRERGLAHGDPVLPQQVPHCLPHGVVFHCRPPALSPRA